MVKGFTVLREETLPFYNGKATLVRHDATGMKIFYFRPEKNNENFFKFIFRTPVSDDTGVAHALEHMVLQGSEKYPLKNLFSQLKRKSLASKSNAATSKCYTEYFSETYVPEDYYRMLDAIGDACFFPILDEQMFKQEVWRFDLDENQKPFINGVVFNEMSNDEKTAAYTKKKYLESKLYKGSEYAYISGGDFLEIPNLTVEKLSDFHKKYYVPENCLLFLFGKINLDEQLKFLEEKLLCRLPSGTSASCIKDEIIPQPSFTELKIDVPYDGVDSNNVELHIMCKDGPRNEYLERDFFFNRINILLDKQLKYSELGEFCSFQKEAPHNKYFVMMFENVKKEDVEKAKKNLVDSLNHCLDLGMDYEELDSACKSKDLTFERSKEITEHINLSHKICDGWCYYDNCFEYLKQKEEWNELKGKILSYDDEKFRAMLKTYLIDNPNKVFVVKTPDKNYFEKIKVERRKSLEKKLSELPDGAIEIISKQKEEFENFLKIDDTSLIKKLFPPLNIKELKEIDDAGLDVIEAVSGKDGPVMLFSSSQETDGKIHITLNYAIDDLSKKEFQNLPWVREYFTSFGFSGMSVSQVDSLMEKLGLQEKNINFCYKGSDSGGREIYENRYWMSFEFSFYEKNIDECLSVIEKFIYERNLQDEKEKSFVKEKLMNLLKRIEFSKAGIFSAKKVRSYFTKQLAFDDEVNGVNSLNKGTINSDEDVESLLDEWQKIYNKIIHGSGIVNLFCEEKNLAEAKKSVSDFISKIGIKPLKENSLTYLDEELPESEKEVSTILIPSSTASGSVEIALRGSKYGTKEFAAEKVLLTWFNKERLYENLSKHHGAYGCGSIIDTSYGLITIHTQRDPAPDESLSIIERCLAKLSTLDKQPEIDEDYVKELALKSYSVELSDIKPVRKGAISFTRRLEGTTPELRQKNMSHILNITKADFLEAGKRLCERSKNLKACIVIGNEKQIQGKVICDFPQLLR